MYDCLCSRRDCDPSPGEMDDVDYRNGREEHECSLEYLILGHYEVCSLVG